MAKNRNEKKRKKADPPDELPESIARHISRLGLGSAEEYFAWCRENGHRTTIHKSAAALCRERSHIDEREAEEVLRRSKQMRNPAQVLAGVARGEIEADTVRGAQLTAAARRVAGLGRRRPHRELLSDFLLAVTERADLLLDSARFGDRTYSNLDALIALNERRGQWIRPLADWKVRTHNSRRQLSSLARHLLAKYPVPVFLDAAWFRRDRGAHAYRDWFVHLGAGQNMRTASTPFPMTKKTAHHFLLAPDHYSIEHALRYGQVRALGGDARLVDSIVATPIGASFEHDEFWLSVIRFLVAQPMLDPARVGPIVDFIRHQKFEPIALVRRDGTLEHRPPPKPNFSMQRRKLDTLLAQVDRWHQRLGRHAAGHLAWPTSGIEEFREETGQANRKNRKVVVIRELRSQVALRAEGRAMRHCVVSYGRSCATGRCSIWTLEIDTDAGLQKRLTIEVSRQRVIVQCRGRLNQPPTPHDRRILSRWAAAAGLTLSSHL